MDTKLDYLGEKNSAPVILKNIKYKEIPTGFVETIKPKNIKVGLSYRIPVSGSLLSGETAYGVGMFHLHEDEEVIVAKGGEVIILERR